MPKALEKVIIGTAQWGMDYGISNEKGQLPISQIKLITEIAKKSGCKLLDTASSYGESQTIIGKLDDDSFDVITKLLDLDIKAINSDKGIKEEVRDSLGIIKKKSLTLLWRTLRNLF